MNAHRRHDISDRVWLLLEPHLPGRSGSWGGIAKDNRQFINGVFWIMLTGAPWRDLPPDYGDWSNTHRRFIRWRDKGIWEKLLEILIDAPDYEWLMIDASHCKAHPPRKWSKRRQPGYEPHKRGINTKLHLAVDSNDMPVRALITQGTTADCTQEKHLIDGISAENLLADHGYDGNSVVEQAIK